MPTSYLVTLAVTGFGVAFLHAAIPTHWLPFVVVGRARNWSQRRILWAVALAGSGHILGTTLLGIALARFGFEFDARFDHAFHFAVAGILIALGAWLAFRAPHGAACSHGQGAPQKLIPDATDHAALWGLFLTLTVSPCELLLPVYLTAAPFGWRGVLWLSLVLAVATLVGMLALTWATLRSLQFARLRWLLRTDRRLLGGLLCTLGVATVLLEA